MCNDQGSTTTACDDDSGKCSCKEFVVGNKCTECEKEHFGFPDCTGIVFQHIVELLLINIQILLIHVFDCIACVCNPEGSEDNFCNVDSGHCYCKTNNIAGDNCEKCAETFFGFPNCQGMNFVLDVTQCTVF